MSGAHLSAVIGRLFGCPIFFDSPAKILPTSANPLDVIAFN